MDGRLNMSDDTETTVTESAAGPVEAGGSSCPLCGAASARVDEVPGWGSWQQCGTCTHVFADPLELPTDEKTMFGDAYRGDEHRAAMDDFAERVKQRETLLEDPSLWFWTPAFEEVLTWAKERAERGRVLEIGCGLGFFLHAMRRAGLTPAGLDVAEPVVELNRRDGFEVWHGTVDSAPAEWSDPDVVVAEFMLHHVVDPVGFLKEIRSRWPGRPLGLAVYGPSMVDPARSTPPRTLHRWNARSLAEALEQAGYLPRVNEIESTGIETRKLSSVRGIQRRLLGHPRLYRTGKRVAQRVLPRLLRGQRQAAYVVTAYGDEDA
jgi:SAM-dependent methyltransferase